MAQAKSISLSHFTTAVHAAVKAAAQKHPKFKLEAPSGITFSYLIRGFPVPDTFLANATFSETQSFANEVANQISAQPGIALEASLGGKGAIYSAGGHVILGIPAVENLQLEK
jgi:hypothetical protein